MDIYFHICVYDRGIIMSATSTRTTNVNHVSYSIGYGLSVVWTFLAYLTVAIATFSRSVTVAILVILAGLQLATQMICFLHITEKDTPRWRLVATAFTVMILVIVVAGSLWIMNSLNYNMHMTPDQMDTYMHSQSNRGF